MILQDRFRESFVRINKVGQLEFFSFFRRAAASLLVMLCGFTFYLTSASAATLPTGFTETQVSSGLINPTAMAFAPDGRIFVCQQSGQLRVIKNGALLATPFLTVAVDSAGERGLLGIAFDPNFLTNGFIYIYYTATTPAVHNRVSRFTASGDTALAGSEVVLLELNNLSGATNHNGGAMHFGPDGRLYVAVGDNVNGANAQTLTNLLGKILRINADGTIPTDNPFFSTTTGNNRAIWALGLRNPYTFAFQPGTGRMFINDVGETQTEEINDGIAGANYGWPTCEGSCANPSFRNPIFSYGHGSSATTGCAITGGAFYNPQNVQFPSDYVGKYLFADFCSGWIRRLDPATNTATGFATGISNPVDLQVSSDGSLYYLARGSGAVFRVQYTVNATLQLGQASYSVSEGVGSFDLIVNRTGNVNTAVTVNYQTSDAAGLQNCNVANAVASARCDYKVAVGTLRFAAGETSKNISMSIVDDVFVEGAETFNISLSNPAGGAGLGATASASITITDNGNEGAANPIDQTAFFVRQHYIDFLNREPDPQGFTDWQSILNNCPTGNHTCDRIEVSSGFFRSPEFRERGYFPFRFYLVSLGRKPSYAEFMPDLARVSGFLTEAEKEQARLDFIAEFMARQEFANIYNSLTNNAYVQRLFDTAGVTQVTVSGSTQTVTSMQQAMTTAGKTRAAVLRELVESPEVDAKFYTQAFVVMQYFGYLRRDPDALYQQLIDEMNVNPQNYRQLVNVFVNSMEYRARFGSP
jgi:glucose/arabinose dehydrogenase